jgi:hypothetical protein
MGKDTPTLPPVPDRETIAEVIRLAELHEAERDARRQPGRPTYRPYRDADLPRPARHALVDHIRSLPDVTLAGLYAVYSVGRDTHTSNGCATNCFRISFEIAMKPRNSKLRVIALVAEGSLADRLRCGLAHLGLPADLLPPRPARDMRLANHPED